MPILTRDHWERCIVLMDAPNGARPRPSAYASPNATSSSNASAARVP